MSEEIEDYRKYIDEKKEFYDHFISFIESSQENEDVFNYLINSIRNKKYEKNREELEHFLQLIINISNNHCRKFDLINKIENIILKFKEDITRTFTNNDIFNIFKSNKLIVHFLLENGILTFNEQICTEIIYKTELNENEYCLYFYPEIKALKGEEKIQSLTQDLFEIDRDILNDFDEKRHKGEHDSYICSLIRQDSVEEFIIYVNKLVYPLSSQIKPSLFETNALLIESQPTLIEYAAFYGSIQIFQYLKFNGVCLTPSLWLYAIHSNNPEMIHLLEDDHIEPPNLSYANCIIESIKCHHNDIANYFKSSQFLDKKEEEVDDIISTILNCHNYSMFPYEIDKNHAFFYLCFNNFYTLVNLYIKMKEKEIKDIIGITIRMKFFLNAITISTFSMTFQNI